MKRFFILLIGCLLSNILVGQTNWTKHPDPVMVNGSNGAWDENLDYIGSVIFSNNTYMMWYSGWSKSNIEAVGLATSEDGITWTRDANNPVFEIGPKGSWDDTYVSCGDVTMVDDTFHMWYTGYTGNWSQTAIGHAYSIDGINWERDPVNPVLTLEMDGSIDNGWIWIDEVVFDGDRLHMWYVTGNKDIQEGYVRHATSIDGSQWTIDPSNPAILPGNPEDWDYPVVGFPGVIYDGSLFHMWYAGGNNNPSHIYDIGYATSTDGSNWDKYAGNPVMVKGPGSWDAASVFAPNVIDSAGSKYKMWYNGRPLGGGFNAKFGYAESSPFVDIPDTAFLHALIDEGVDTNGDSLISYKEAEYVKSLNVKGRGYWVWGNISDMTGIEAFVELELLECSANDLTSLDVSNNTALLELYCSSNQLTSLDVSNNTALTKLYCSSNRLNSLDVSYNTALTYLDCVGDGLTSLDVSYNKALTHLDCMANQLTSLDVSNNTALTYLDCGDNQLTTLDLSNNTNLEKLYLDDNPSLQQVCVWETPFPPKGVYLDRYGSTNVHFTTECSDYLAPEIIAVDTLYQSEDLEVTCSEDGMIYLVPVNTGKDLEVICGACMDSVEAVMNTPVNISLEGIDNGIYWLYARDTSGNISEPKAITIMGVGIEQRNSDNLRIYPNPTYTQLTIETANSDMINIEITSLNGQLLLSKEMEGTIHQLDLSSFQSGVYFITIRSKDFVATRKIVKL